MVWPVAGADPGFWCGSHIVAGVYSPLSIAQLNPSYLGASVSARLQTEAALLVAARRQTDVDISEVVDRLPPEVVENLPADVLEGLSDGTLSEIPTDIMDNLEDRLPSDVLDRVPAEFLADPTNRLVIGVMAVIALVSVAGFLYGVMKSAMKAAFFFAVVAAVAAFMLYTNAR